MLSHTKTFDVLVAHHRNVLIPQGTLARIERGRGVVLHVERGSVWMTQAGSLEDSLLEPGDCARIAGDGLALLTSYGKDAFALLRLERAQPARRPLSGRLLERVAGWLHLAGARTA